MVYLQPLERTFNMDRDRTKQLTEHANKMNKQKKELELSKNLRREVDINAGGSSRYRIKSGPNKGKVL
mgnify:FL=1